MLIRIWGPRFSHREPTVAPLRSLHTTYSIPIVLEMQVRDPFCAGTIVQTNWNASQIEVYARNVVEFASRFRKIIFSPDVKLE